MYQDYIMEQLRKGISQDEIAKEMSQMLNEQIAKFNEEELAKKKQVEFQKKKTEAAENLAQAFNTFTKTYYPELSSEDFGGEDILSIFSKTGPVAKELAGAAKTWGKAISKELKDGKWTTKVKDLNADEVIAEFLKAFDL